MPEGPLRLLLSGKLSEHVYSRMYTWTYVSCSCIKKVDLRFSNGNAMTDLHKTWYVGSGGHKYYPRGLLSPNTHIKYLISISVLIG